MEGWIVDGWMDIFRVDWIDGLMIDGCMEGWMDGYMKG